MVGDERATVMSGLKGSRVAGHAPWIYNLVLTLTRRGSVFQPFNSPGGGGRFAVESAESI